jgi:hypothetical protein
MLLGGPPQGSAVAANGDAAGKGKKGGKEEQAAGATWLEPTALATLLGKGAGELVALVVLHPSIQCFRAAHNIASSGRRGYRAW